MLFRSVSQSRYPTHIDLDSLTSYVNLLAKGDLKISAFSWTTRDVMTRLKAHAEFAQKVYRTLIFIPECLSRSEFDVLCCQCTRLFTNAEIQQRTPTRILARKPDRTRSKQIHSLECEWVDPAHLRATVVAQGGTYIKELISGDGGRTHPSLSEIAQKEMMCVELDVIEIRD